MNADRWSITKSYRRPMRGSADRVHDGWTLTDSVGSAVRWAPTRGGAIAMADQVEADEDQARTLLPFAATYSFIPPSGRSRPTTEVWFQLRRGAPHPRRGVKVGLVSTENVEANAAALMAHLGGGHIPRAVPA